MSDLLRYNLQMPAHPSAVRVARGVVRHLNGALSPDQLDRAETIVSELVTNAIRYGSPRATDVDLELTVRGSVMHGCVRDHGPAFTLPPVEPRQDRPGGFGLHIAGQLAADFEVARSGDGNIVSFRV